MPEEFVDLVSAKNASEAQLIRAVLESAGIPARTEGDHLADEWAASQRLMGQLGTTVRVPAHQLDAARAALAEARQAASDTPDFDDDEGREARRIGSTSPYDAALRARSWPGGAIATTCILGAACLLLATFLVAARVQITELQYDANFTYEWNASGTELTQREKRTGRRASVFEDENGDRIWEVIQVHSPSGGVATRHEDLDGNGWFETTRQFTPKDGRVVFESTDLDSDGRAEKVVIETADRRKWVFEDSDGDGEFDPRR